MSHRYVMDTPGLLHLLISHLSQRVSLRRALVLISVKLKMRKKQQQKMMSLVRQQSMANEQP